VLWRVRRPHCHTTIARLGGPDLAAKIWDLIEAKRE
jgi:hypothetical protein